MKKTLLPLFLLILLFACKKDKNNVDYNIIGTWVLSASNINGQTYFTTDFPCMANQILVVESNNSAMYKWHDDQTCWVNQAHTVSLNLPGSDSTSVSFVRNSNNLVFTSTHSNVLSSTGQITSLNNNKLQLTINLTYTVYNNPLDTMRSQSVYIKE